MKPEEAIERLEYLESALDGYPPETGINDVFAAIDTAIEALKEIQQYREIGTVEECREAVEKQKPKKPIPINYQDYADKIDNAEFFEGSYFCPNCGTVLRSGSYCNRCGQKLGWNENLEGMEDVTSEM